MKQRDRLLVVGAAVAVAAIASLIIVTVLDAARRGVDALEDQKREQIEQLSRSMEAQIGSAVSGFAGIVARPYTFEIDDPGDLELLESLGFGAEATTGIYLVDPQLRITNGILLRDPDVVGTRLDNPKLADLMETGGVAILPVGEGLTTALPVIDIAATVAGADGRVRGALVIEAEASADSAFNQQVAPLGGESSGEFLILDENGAVVASSEGDFIGLPVDDETLRGLAPGLYRRGGRVVVIGDIPSASWTAVFRQDADDFEGGLSQRLGVATLLVVVAGAIGAVISVITVTRRLQASREEQRRLRELNRTREEFISIVSHELRTPVAGVLGFLESTIDHWDAMEDAQRRQAVVRAAGNARRLQALARDVLDTSSVEEGRLRYVFGRVDLGAELESAVTAMRELQPDRDVELARPDTPVIVRADGDRIVQVLMNLFENAANSSPPGSAVNLSLQVEGGDAMVAVSDHGPGLSAEERDEVFVKFARGHRTGVRGTGLGLYLAREIVTAHNGRIWAEQRAGVQGATFVFTIPLADAADSGN